MKNEYSANQAMKRTEAQKQAEVSAENKAYFESKRIDNCERMNKLISIVGWITLGAIIMLIINAFR